MACTDAYLHVPPPLCESTHLWEMDFRTGAEVALKVKKIKQRSTKRHPPTPPNSQPYFGSRNREQKPVGCPRLSPRSRPRLRAADQPLSLAPRATALDRYRLQKAGFTHVLNAAHGSWNVDTGPDYYRDMAIEYHGVEADDLPTFDLSVFFYPAAAFIDAALRYNHTTLVLAYLMIHRNMTLVDAIQQVAKNRCVLPNRGFLKQLRELDKQLVQQRRQARHGGDGEKAGEKEL
eukprot:bmy_10648T0